jgi:UDP-N-acetylglucosamine--dolichyl-phosphate N-acetylglucosaminephosphotransferase
MIDSILLLPFLVSFFAVLIFVPHWIKRAREEGLVGRDIQKLGKTFVPEGGGIAVVAAFILGIMSYIAIKTFYFKSSENVLEILAIASSILIVAIIGLIDTVLGWKKGLSRKFRIFLILFAAVPLMVINAGRHTMSIPLLGTFDFGLFYPLVLIPLGIVGTTATFNFLAGFNGLEAGQGAIILSALSIVAYLTGHSWLALVLLIMVVSLLAFLSYNFYPAKVFPGDTLTYSVGGLIAVSAILGNFEKIAVFFFIPYIIEVILKCRGKLVKQSFGKPQKDGSLDMLYDKVYGLTHLSIYLMKKLGIKPTERRVVLSIWAFQILVIIIGFIVFREGIF